MKRFFILTAFIMLCMSSLPAQNQIAAERKVRFGIIVEGDTLPYYQLHEVKVVSSGSLLSDKIGKQRLDELERRIAGVSKKDRKAAIKAAEKDLLADFSDELKDCTISQGKVLLKLIDRETGRTSYVLVDELRGKLRAGFYQTFARLFGYNLKAQYDPKNNKEDNLIERIVLSVEYGRL